MASLLPGLFGLGVFCGRKLLGAHCLGAARRLADFGVGMPRRSPFLLPPGWLDGWWLAPPFRPRALRHMRVLRRRACSPRGRARRKSRLAKVRAGDGPVRRTRIQPFGFALAPVAPWGRGGCSAWPCGRHGAAPFGASRLSERLRCVVYSDATGHGNVAWAICLPAQRVFSAAEVPKSVWRWARFRRNQVATWELLAAICALHWLLSQGFGELEVLLFVDNNTALGTLIRGSSRQADWNDLIGDLWLRVARAGVLLYSFYVPSHLNLADAPTRPRQKAAALEAMQAAGFAQVPWASPPDAPWHS